MTPYQDKQHVAVYIIWFKRYDDCSSNTPGTVEFYDGVLRFKGSLTNIGSGKDAVRDIVNNFYDNEWLPSVNADLNYLTRYTNDMCTIEEDGRLILYRRIHEVFDFIVQTIQDTGRGWPTQDDMQSFNITQK